MYITINSEFKPFTYDELTKPLRDYTEAYNKVEEQYATLAQQTEAWKNIATQENSPEAYAMYKKYSDELNAVVEDFSKGMTIQNRSKLSGLKSRYASEITPISIAYDAMQKANAYRDTIKGQDASAVFNIDKYNSLDDFLFGKQADNSYISGYKIQDKVSDLIDKAATSNYNYLINMGVPHESAYVASKNHNYEELLLPFIEGIGLDNLNEEAQTKLSGYITSGYNKGLNSFTAKENTGGTSSQRDSSTTSYKKLLEEYEARQQLLAYQEEDAGTWYGKKGAYQSNKDVSNLYSSIETTITSRNSDTTSSGTTESSGTKSSSKGSSSSSSNSTTDKNSSSNTDTTTYKSEVNAKVKEGRAYFNTLNTDYEDSVKDAISQYARDNGLTEKEVRENLNYWGNYINYEVYRNVDGSDDVYIQLPRVEDLIEDIKTGNTDNTVTNFTILYGKNK